MLKQERQHFALLNGPSQSHTANLRKQAWEDVLAKAGVEIVGEAEGDWSAESGYLQVTKLLLQPNKCDVILVSNDQMALGALRACNEQNVPVPQQVAVTGFDDTLNSEYFNPPLTTIRQDFLEIGRQAVQKVLHQLNDDDKAVSKQLIPIQLIERQSTMLLQQDANVVQKIDGLLQEIQRLLPSMPQ